MLTAQKTTGDSREKQLTTKNEVRKKLDEVLRMTNPPALLAEVMRDILDEMQAEGGGIA